MGDSIGTLTATTAAAPHRDDTGQRPAFEVRATLVRYVRAGDGSEAAGAGSAGLQLTCGGVPASSAWVETVGFLRASAKRYRHAGHEGLWRVAVDIGATVRAASEEEASEVAYQLGPVSRR